MLNDQVVTFTTNCTKREEYGYIVRESMKCGMKITVNDLINDILGVLGGGAFNRYEAFIREGRLLQFN